MQTQSLLRNCFILSALALGGCPSDDEGITGTASNSGTESETDDDSDSDEDSDSDSDSEPTMGSNSNSDTTPTTETTDDPTTVDTTDDPTDPTDSDTDTDPSSSSASASESESESETDPSSSSSDSASDSDSNSGSSSESTGQVSVSESNSNSESDSDSDSDTNVDPDCEAPGEIIACDSLAAAPTQFQAIGLGCDGDANQVIPINNEVFSSAAGAWRVATQFGTYIDPGTNEPLWSAREGDQMLIISTGAISAPNGQGVVTMGLGAHQGGVNNANPDGQNLPAPMSPTDGGQGGPFVDCDGVGDCSNTLEAQWDLGGGDANDLLWMQFDTAVPGGTNGFSFDFAYFSAEFPEYVSTTFNDIFLAWSASETYTGNLCFINDQPCTVTALCNDDDTCPDLAYCDDSLSFFAQCANPVANDELAGTGFDGVGGSTGWFTANGSAQPGEDLQLTFALFDMGDSIYDTAVLLDNWRWDCEGCVPSEVMGCGIEPTP